MYWFVLIRPTGDVHSLTDTGIRASSVLDTVLAALLAQPSVFWMFCLTLHTDLPHFFSCCGDAVVLVRAIYPVLGGRRETLGKQWPSLFLIFS